ncbi:MAG: helix-turn-helix transcriptional regulator [Candidatus Abyssubacteria bacterium]|nr:helix-turn-helix transcriptional regulator [Candidatus Abyssubacteria bacterium]
MTLGEKIRNLRQDKKMTLQDVAGETGYSKALISRIENDSVSPSIGSLVKIASALDIRLYELFAAVEGTFASVVRKKDRRSRTIAGGKIKVEGLNEDSSDSKLGAVIMTFDSGTSASEGKAKAHAGEEWWHVLKGELEAAVGERKYRLAAGDSLYVSSSMPHAWRNAGKGKASALVVMTPSGA